MSGKVFFSEATKDDGFAKKTALPGFWMIYIMTVVFLIALFVNASLGYVANENIVNGQSETFPELIKWFTLTALIVLGLSFLVSPFLIFASFRIASLYFLFALLGMCLLATTLLNYAQSNNVPGNDNFVSNFEDTVHWTMISMLAVGSVSFFAILFLTLIPWFDQKKNQQLPTKVVTQVTPTPVSTSPVPQTPEVVREAMNFQVSPITA